MDFFDYLTLMNHSRSDQWAAFKQKEPVQSTKKLIAYYLPQFHPFSENDSNWGQGFTEWRNVARGQPLFEGHIQPHHPADLGFYDLRSPDVLREQAKLARNYGISGLSFYYYWFDSKIFMDTPIENLYNNPDIDIEYCVFWANENWTRSWDGLENEVLLRQNHSPEDDIRFIAQVSRYFSDPRYIRYNNKPLLMVYRIGLLPNARETSDRWRNWCEKNGVEVPYLVAGQAMGSYAPPEDGGFDAAVEFPPHPGTACDRSHLQSLQNLSRFTQQREINVIDYHSAVKAWSHRNPFNYKHFKCCFPSWDNSPRRINSCSSIFAWSNPDLYSQWLSNCLNIADEGDFVFINAWNEWTEGAYLEPDLFWGHAYLEATWKALAASSSVKE